MCIFALAIIVVSIAYVMEVILPKVNEIFQEIEDRRLAPQRELEALRIKYGKKV